MDLRMSKDPQRLLHRTWKRKPHLPKYSSLPELQLIPRERPLFHCKRCGFSNVLVPLCLWCTWSSQEAEHEFRLSLPRAKRVSAPCRLFFHASLSTSLCNNPHAHRKSVSWNGPVAAGAKNGSTMIPEPPFASDKGEEFISRCATKRPTLSVEVGTINDRCPGSLSDRGSDDAVRLAGRRRMAVASTNTIDVTTATQSFQNSLSGFAGAQISRQGYEGVGLRPSHATHRRHLASQERPFIPPSSVDRTLSEPMTVPKSSKGIKASRRLLFIDLEDMKYSSVTRDDDGPSTPSPIQPESPTQQHLRTLRRKNHLNVVQTAISKPKPEPISISFSLHRPSSSTTAKSPHSPSQPSTETRSRHYSMISNISSPVTPPSTTSPLPPPSTSPSGLFSTPQSSPVKIGHPTRPYYSAIRKGGVSPPSSRPGSVMGSAHVHLTPFRSRRPQSYDPPTSNLGLPDDSPVTSRHLSMSSMFAPALYSSPSSGLFSAFSLIDDNEEDEDSPTTPHTPSPNVARFPPSSDVNPSSGAGFPLTQSHKRAKVPRNTGCSMSGETELRMALATNAARPATAGSVERGFRFRETTPQASNNNTDTLTGRLDPRHLRKDTKKSGPPQSRTTFMNRVKKLRRGIRDILRSNVSTASTTTN